MEKEMKKSFEELLDKLAENEIHLNLVENGDVSVGKSKFGGEPDLPPDFEWEYFEENGERNPLAFLAQFDLAEAAEYDKDGLLPKSGLLSFFYDVVSQPWGFDPKDKGCSRVYYFPEGTKLVRTPLPEDMDEEAVLAEFALRMTSERSVPDVGELECYAAEKGVEYPDCSDEDEDELYDDIAEISEDDNTKLLGYPAVIQNPMREECEETTRGLYVGNGDYSKQLTDEERADIREKSRDWILLFQMDDSIADTLGTMFGDSGSIYFWIRKQDLAECRFENAWLILQCY